MSYLPFLLIMHNLNLDIKDNNNCKTLVIQDISLYDKELEEIDNLILEIKPPGSDCFIPFYLLKDFKTILNCSALNLCCINCPSDITELPDGNYEIKFSVAPNKLTMHEFNYFRTCKLKSKYTSALCSLIKSKCDFTKKEYEKKINELYDLKMFIESSKHSSEDCLNVESALELYNKAKKKLESIEHTECNTC